MSDLPDIPAGLQDVLSCELRDPGLRLSPSSVQGANSRGFVCTCSDGRRLFVKVAPREKLFRSHAVLTACSGCAFVPQLRCDQLLECGNERVLVTDFATGQSVANVLDLSSEQFHSWIADYIELSSRLQSLRGQATAPRSYGSASGMLDMLEGRLRGRKIALRILWNLFAIRKAASEIDRRLTQVIHGDFAFNNFLFEERGLSAMLDFDSLTIGLPTEDLIHSFVLRFRDTSIRGAKYARLCGLLRSAAALSPWPIEDWHAAIDLKRLCFAIYNLGGCSVGMRDILRTRREDARLARMHRVVGERGVA